MIHRLTIIVSLLFVSLASFGATTDSDTLHPETFIDGAEVSVQLQGALSTNKFAPLWFSNNHYGAVSPYGNSANERVAIIRDVASDSLRQWRWGYGLDLQFSQNAVSKFFVQQAFIELKWKKLQLTLGSKERKIDFRNNQLTLGTMTQGINARPNPMVMLETDYVKFLV